MADPLENPVINDDAEAKLLQAASHVDRGEDIPADLVPVLETPVAPAVEPETPAAEKTDDSTKPERPRDALGRFTKTEAGVDIPEAERKPAEAKVEAAPTGPDSEYTAAKKERARQENLLKNFQQEKEVARREIETERQRLAQERQQLEQQRQSRTQDPNKPQYTSKEFYEAHQDFKKQAKAALDGGDYDEFGKLSDLAEQALITAGQVQQTEGKRQYEARVQQWNDAWNANADVVFKAEPDVINPETPLGKTVTRLMETHGNVFYSMPDGVAKAVELAKLQLEATSAAELREANKTMAAELAEARSKLQPLGAGPTSPPEKKRFDDMSADQQEAALLEAAARVDSGQ